MDEENVQSDDDVGLQIQRLANGVFKSFENATDLFEEASLLHKDGRLCRALFLHQISLEECGKCEILGWSVTSVLAGQAVDLATLSKRIREHKEKNFANAYSLPVSTAEAAAKKEDDWREASRVFAQQQTAFHSDSNETKNAALYVNCGDGRFSSPKETITGDMVASIATVNSEFVSLMRPKVKMLKGWLADPKAAGEVISQFMTRLEELKAEGSRSPDEILSTTMNEWRKHGSK